jgi:hypothetical protein
VTGERAYLVGAGAVIGFALAYALPIVAGWPLAIYEPLAHRFSLGLPAGGVTLGYFGQVLWGLSGGLIGGVLGASVGLGAAWRRKPVTEGAAILAGAWALTALVLVGAYFTWLNWP